MTELHAVANAIMRTKYELSEELALQHHYQPPPGGGARSNGRRTPTAQMQPGQMRGIGWG